ncbi:U6 snRNA phosphodiesterase Usb1 [Pilaira anomala]|nr:U6 snRNA phosphodiesterase Usb1 [Pilaira anomala]
MPKLSSFFGEASAVKEKLIDDIGKVRAVPHKKDSWATYVYFQVDLTDDKPKLLKYCMGLEPIEEQHVSLSRTVYLKQNQLKDFVKSIRDAIGNKKAFKVSFAQVACLTNDEKTRSFLTLEVGNGYNELFAFLKQVDKVMEKFKQPKFYDPPRFHTSLAWSTTEEKVKSVKIPPTELEQIIQQSYHINRLYIKQGHLVMHIDLQ